MKNIVGILSTSQPVKFGKTKNGKPIYQIKPIKKILPPFWITYGGKLQGRIIISFKFKEWTDDSKSPFGEIIKIIGLVDDSNLSETLLSHYEIDRKSFAKNELKLNEFESTIIRKDLKDLNIFSIDPKGCIDIDDALSYQEIEDKIYIGVHIAQPICWLSKQEIIDRCQTAFSTLYLNEEKNKNLWSNELTEKASLFVNQEKPAYTTIFTIQNSKVINIESFPSIIINKLNTCYEKINFPDIQKTKEITEKLIGKEIDSHELVSYWMVETNKYIGNTFKNIPFRIQNIDENKKNIEIVDTKVKDIFSNMLLEGASYSYEKDYHQSLGEYKYTHFTSPIRRIIDTVIHFNITYQKDEIILDLEKINLLDYKTKKFHRQINLLETIKNLPNEKETIGYIYSKNTNNNSNKINTNNINTNKWMVYFEEIGLTKVKIWDNKFDYLENKTFDKYEIGKGYTFKIFKKTGFLPNEKILINLKI